MLNEKKINTLTFFNIRYDNNYSNQIISLGKLIL